MHVLHAHVSLFLEDNTHTKKSRKGLLLAFCSYQNESAHGDALRFIEFVPYTICHGDVLRFIGLVCLDNLLTLFWKNACRPLLGNSALFVQTLPEFDQTTSSCVIYVVMSAGGGVQGDYQYYLHQQQSMLQIQS